jgi:TPR repeat protein
VRLILWEINVKKDFGKAIKLWPLAAEKDHPGAQFKLSEIYRQGKKVNIDLELSHNFLVKAASSGLTEAQMALAKAYEDGKSYGKKDQKEAFNW